MIIMELGRNRSSTQAPGKLYGDWRERSAASSGVRACSSSWGHLCCRCALRATELGTERQVAQVEEQANW